MKDIDSLLSSLSECQILTEDEMNWVYFRCRDILIMEDNLQVIQAPVVICGDIHGQFYDLKEIFNMCESPLDTSYLFLGDYVDRGLHSVETIQYILCLKIKFPSRIFLLRGNHETRQVTMVYGFYDECMKKYGDSNVWWLCTDLFDHMPLTALIQTSIGLPVFGVHGGLSPDLSLDSVRLLDRLEEVPVQGTIADMLWSDPHEDILDFKPSPRGAGWLFGYNATKRFNENNGVSMIVRAHQLVMDGYKLLFDEMICTVWSAPNYCYRCGNVASVLVLTDTQEKEFRTFGASKNQTKLSRSRAELISAFI